MNNNNNNHIRIYQNIQADDDDDINITNEIRIGGDGIQINRISQNNRGQRINNNNRNHNHNRNYQNRPLHDRRPRDPFNFVNMRMMLDQLDTNLESNAHSTDMQILNELPETKIEDVNKLDNDKKNCVICLEDFKNGDEALFLPCIHLFHKTCIKNWLKTNNTCPIFKFKLTASNIH